MRLNKCESALLWLILVLLSPSLVHATDSVGFDVSGGIGVSGWDTSGSLDLHPAKVGEPYEASLEVAHQHSTVGTTSQTNQYTGGVSHLVDEHWDSHVDLTYWNDTINTIHYVGPTAGFTYTWLSEEAPLPTRISTSAPASDNDGNLLQENATASDKNETDTDPASKDELASLSFDADLFFYGTDVDAGSTTRRVYDPTLGRYVKKVIGPRTATEKVTQFHPNVTVEKPLFDSAMTPYLVIGHYVYSQNPSAIEAIAGRPRFASSATQLNGLVGGFLSNNGEIGIRVTLPLAIESDVRWGAEQEATDKTWATTQGMTFSKSFWVHLKAKIDWSRTIQTGVSNDLFSGGLTWEF